jgi:hypothetical protein
MQHGMFEKRNWLYFWYIPLPSRQGVYKPHTKIQHCKLVFSFPLHLEHMSLTQPTSQLRIFSMNSISISTKNQRLFPILLEIISTSPAMINLLTCARTSFLPFQNQISNDEGRQSNTLFTVVGVKYYRVWKTQGHCTHSVHCRYLFYSFVFFSFSKKYVRLNRLVAYVLCIPVTFQVGII